MQNANNSKETETVPDFARGAVNLGSAGFGAVALYATDEFFAPLSRMLKDSAPVFLPDEYDEHGKWMDGWESRRKRIPGHDWAVIKLAVPGRIFGFDIDTSHFTGNYPPQASIEAIHYTDGDPHDGSEWIELLPKTDLRPDSHHYVPIADRSMLRRAWTHVRIHIYPDGGIARLRVFGAAQFDWDSVPRDEEVDLAYILHGGRAVDWSDAHYGEPTRLLKPGRGVNMGDGWETARRRGPGYDWAILKLGHPGTINRLVVDTAHFKGNYPDRCDLLGANLPDKVGNFDPDEIAASELWAPILKDAKLQMDHIHEFGADKLLARGPFTHIRFNIHPDGGVSRLRIFGHRT